MLVVAAALIDRDGRVLIAQRPEGKAMAGLWEFPGGKVEPGETPEAALIRELDEELGIDTWASCLAPLSFASHAYPEFHLLMPLFACRKWQGTPRAARARRAEMGRRSRPRAVPHAPRRSAAPARAARLALIAEIGPAQLRTRCCGREVSVGLGHFCVTVRSDCVNHSVK